MQAGIGQQQVPDWSRQTLTLCPPWGAGSLWLLTPGAEHGDSPPVTALLLVSQGSGSPHGASRF